jgi:hypothetical protein
MSTGSPLFNLLADLAKKRDVANQFKEDPGTVMDDYGVDGDTKEMLLASAANNDDSLAHEAYSQEASRYLPKDLEKLGWSFVVNEPAA